MKHRDSLSDRCLSAMDCVLKTLTAPPGAQSPLPGKHIRKETLSAEEKTNAARLMRVNHAGEIAAQGLYHGQALCARNYATMCRMKQNAREESNHLAWCKQRIYELDGHVSLFNPFWYLGSFGIGMLAGLAGDRWSLGFVKETEVQVIQHLNSHLHQLSPNDKKTAVIIQRIAADEADHAQNATAAGGRELPAVVKQAMRITAKMMTKTSRYL